MARQRNAYDWTISLDRAWEVGFPEGDFGKSLYKRCARLIRV